MRGGSVPHFHAQLQVHTREGSVSTIIAMICETPVNECQLLTYSDKHLKEALWTATNAFWRSQRSHSWQLLSASAAGTDRVHQTQAGAFSVSMY